jgi:hypothetical protein
VLIKPLVSPTNASRVTIFCYRCTDCIASVVVPFFASLAYLGPFLAPSLSNLLTKPTDLSLLVIVAHCLQIVLMPRSESC